MLFSADTYSVLVVSGQQKLNEALRPMLPSSEFYPVSFCTNAAAARRELVGRRYDLVIVNAPLPDESGTRFAIDTGSRTDTVVLLLLRAESFEEVDAQVTP